MSDITNLHVCSLGIANRLMDACASRGIIDITNMKVQKLCYYVYALFVTRNDSILFDCEDVMFWKFGPVIPRVYDSLKHYQSGIIDSFILDDCPFDNLDDPNDNDVKLADIKDHKHFDSVMTIINEVLDACGNKTAHQLRDMSHQTNSAWHSITSNGLCVYERLKEDNLNFIKDECNAIFH